MAIFTTLITATKLLVKNMAKKKLKERAKKFVTGGKDKDKKKRVKTDEKVEKRETFLQSQQRKVAEMKASPNYKPLKTSKLMNTDADKIAKVKPDSAKIDYDLFTEKVDNIVGMTDALVFLTGAQSDQEKEKLKLLRQQKEKQKKKKKEAKLEKGAMGMIGNVGKGIKSTAQGPLDMVIKFLTNIVLGSLAVFLINNGKKIQKFFQGIGENLELFSKLLRFSIFGFKGAMVLANKGLELAARGISRVLSPIRKAFQLIGSKISGAFASLANKFLQVIQKIPGVSQVTNLARTAGQGLQVARQGISTVFNSATGNVFRRGLERAPSRLITKLFGPKTAKMVANSTKMFKSLNLSARGIRIPVLGPIIVAVTSILSGDPLGKTLFKTIGTVMGGMIGGAIGASFTFGAAAPLGMLLGEILGEFIGTFIYEVFNGDASGKKGVGLIIKKIGQILSAPGKIAKHLIGFAFSILGNIANFFKDGVRRFIDNFPTINISKIPLVPRGLRFASNNVPLLGGLKKYQDAGDNNKVNTLPNLGLLAFPPLLLPHLIKSFFPSAKVKEAEKQEKVGKASDSVFDELEAKYGGGDDDEFIGSFTSTSSGIVRYEDQEGNEIDALSPEAEGLKKDALELFESYGGSTKLSSDVSAISNQASYEKSSAGTVILEKPKRSDFDNTRSGANQYSQAMVMYGNQKSMLNSYFKTQVRASLYKI